MATKNSGMKSTKDVAAKYYDLYEYRTYFETTLFSDVSDRILMGIRKAKRERSDATHRFLREYLMKDKKTRNGERYLVEALRILLSDKRITQHGSVGRSYYKINDEVKVAESTTPFNRGVLSPSDAVYPEYRR